MAAITMAEPGSKYGPCLKSCEHRDCAAARAEACRECSECGAPIGFETRYYGGDKPIHAVCAMDKLERLPTGTRD